MPDNPWNTERGRAALNRVAPGLIDFDLSPRLREAYQRDLAREWLVERDWTLSCAADESIAKHEEHGLICLPDYDDTEIAAIEATPEPSHD